MALIVKKSNLPGAGKGLFTTRPIPKHSRVICYRGELIGEREFRARVAKGEDHYIFCIRRGRYIDAMHTRQYKARYANDALGFARLKNVRNNSYYALSEGKCYIVASRNINAGEEIYVSYTCSYWNSLRKREQKLKRKRTGSTNRQITGTAHTGKNKAAFPV